MPSILHSVTRSGKYEVFAGVNRSSPNKISSADLLEYHFAYSARPFLKSNNDLRKAPAVFHFHGPWFAEGRFQGNGLARTAIKWLYEFDTYRRFSTFLAASNAFAMVLHDSFRIPAQRIQTIYPGVDTERFAPGDKRVARAELGLPLEGKYIACVRRLEPRMGIDVAVRAMRDVPDATLMICGTGSLSDRLRGLVEDLGLERNVVFLGRVSDEKLPLVYQSADVSVVPTVALEGFGMIVLESLASGTPVIASNVGGLTEALGPFAPEWGVAPGDPDELAEKLRWAIASVPSATDARAYAESRDLASMARRVEELTSDG